MSYSLTYRHFSCRVLQQSFLAFQRICFVRRRLLCLQSSGVRLRPRNRLSLLLGHTLSLFLYLSLWLDFRQFLRQILGLLFGLHRCRFVGLRFQLFFRRVLGLFLDDRLSRLFLLSFRTLRRSSLTLRLFSNSSAFLVTFNFLRSINRVEVIRSTRSSSEPPLRLPKIRFSTRSSRSLGLHPAPGRRRGLFQPAPARLHQFLPPKPATTAQKAKCAGATPRAVASD